MMKPNKMKNKSKKSINFIEGLHAYIVNSPHFRKNTLLKTESQIQCEIRPLIVSYLNNYFIRSGIKNYELKTASCLYWEGQEGHYKEIRKSTFASRNYPDFIINYPYRIAIEYKQSDSGSTVKYGIGQSIIHTLCGEFDFVYYLFHDETKDKKIEKSLINECEQNIISDIWNNFNVMLRLV